MYVSRNIFQKGWEMDLSHADDLKIIANHTEPTGRLI